MMSRRQFRFIMKKSAVVVDWSCLCSYLGFPILLSNGSGRGSLREGDSSRQLVKWMVSTCSSSRWGAKRRLLLTYPAYWRGCYMVNQSKDEQFVSLSVLMFIFKRTFISRIKFKTLRADRIRIGRAIVRSHFASKLDSFHSSPDGKAPSDHSFMY